MGVRLNLAKPITRSVIGFRRVATGVRSEAAARTDLSSRAADRASGGTSAVRLRIKLADASPADRCTKCGLDTVVTTE